MIDKHLATFLRVLIFLPGVVAIIGIGIIVVSALMGEPKSSLAGWGLFMVILGFMCGSAAIPAYESLMEFEKRRLQKLKKEFIGMLPDDRKDEARQILGI